MISIPNFIYRLLCAIPFVGIAFKRADFALVYTENHVDVPVFRFIEAFFRTIPVIALCVASFYLFEKVVSENKVVVSELDLVSALDVEDEAFREILRECESQQLVDFLEKSHDDPNLDIDRRIQRFDREIDIAKKVGRSRMLSTQWYGITKELELRANLAMFDLENELWDVERQNELVEMAGLYKSIQFPESTTKSDQLIEWAKFADITATVADSINSQISTDETVVVEDLKIKCNSFIGETFDKTSIDEKLSRLARISEVRLAELGLSTDLVEVLNNTASGILSKTQSTRIEELAAMECENTVASVLPYQSSDPTNAGDADTGSMLFTDPYVKKFREKLEMVWGNDEISFEDLKMILMKLKQISASGWPEEARLMVDKLRKYLESTKYVDLLVEANRFSKLLSWGGLEFSLDGIESLEKTAAKYHFASADATIVLFISMESIVKSNTQLQKSISVLNKLAQTRAKNHFCVVFVHDKDQLNGLPNMRKLAEQVPAMKVWQLDVNSVRGSEVKSVFPLDQLPFSLVLDRNKKVVGFDPKRMQLENVLRKLKTAD